jgi:hypothetical protein
MKAEFIHVAAHDWQHCRPLLNVILGLRGSGLKHTSELSKELDVRGGG